MWSWAWMRNAAEQGQHEACCACCAGTLAGRPQQREAPRRRDHNDTNSSMHAVLGGGAGTSSGGGGRGSGVSGGPRVGLPTAPAAACAASPRESWFLITGIAIYLQVSTCALKGAPLLMAQASWDSSLGAGQAAARGCQGLWVSS